MSYLPRLCAHQPWPLLVCLFMHGIANATETPTPLSAAEILPYVVHHSQAWGQMGLDTCVYAPGATPAPLQIGDTTYPSGLGFHAPGETWITLERKFSIFECEVGVQKQTANQGSVAFRVYADGELVFDSGVLREADGPRSVRIAVDGVHYLKLEYTDGGDGITCDCANWVNVRLTPSPTTPGTDTSAHQSVDIAPFGRVLTWNPYVKDGTHAMRTESFPARDLFPGDDVARDKDGLYPIPLVQHPFADMGMGCIGLEWLEQRRITQASIQFANTAPNPDGVAVEYWAMTPSFDGTPGVSRWQGHWEHLNADIACEGKTWTVLFTQSRRWKHSKTLKLRWIIPRELATNKIEQLSAYTDSAWVDADITLRATQAAPGQQATVTMYNGLILRESNSTTSHSWDLANPLRIRVRYAKEMPWTRSERTTLRLALPAQSFGIAIADVVDSGCVYVESAGIVATPSEKESAADTLLASSTSKKTVLEEVRTLPDQTFTQAIKHVHRPDADLGPTLLSLANGNAKFLLQRNGTIGFDVPDLKDGLGQTFSIAPAWDGQSNETITRHLEDDWMPIVAIAHSQEAVTVQQRAYIAPYGEANALGKAAWYHDKPLCVVEYTLTNSGDAASEVSLTLECKTKGPNTLTLRDHARGIVADSPNGFAALLDTSDARGVAAQIDGSNMKLAGNLAAGATARYVLLIPGWQTTAEALPSASETAALLGATRAHWQAVMAGSMQIVTPDPMLNNVIMASRVHCLLAARNEVGLRVAPWIASTHYGPLESEAHSVIRGMQFMGHEDFARRGLNFFINRYNQEGYLTTGYTVIGTGWHLWALGEYHMLNRNEAWLRGVAPEIDRVSQWILAQREKTKRATASGEQVPQSGLMPPGVLADWGVYSHYFYLDGNYYAGLHWAGRALADIGWVSAPSIQKSAEEYRADITRAFHHVQSQTPVLPLRDGTWVPAYPTQLYCPMPIADLYPDDDAGRSWCYDVELGAHHLVPMGVLDANAPEVTSMMDHMEDVQFLKSGWFYYPEEGNQADWFNLGGFAKVQPYYARNAEVSAMRDDVKPFIRTYFNSVVSLLNREDLSLWEHFMNGAFNKTHETGYFLHQSRLMFVMERGDALWLAPFVPTQWLEDGKTIDIQDAPTFFGTTGFTVTSHVKDGFISAEIIPPARQTPAEIVIRLRHPEGKALVNADVSGASDVRINAEDATIHMTPNKQKISVKAHYAE